jgi:hypothetical protein
MRSIDNEVKKQLMSAYNEGRKQAGMEAVASDATRTVGNNGMAVGQEVELTGVLNPAVPVKNAEGKTTAVFIGLETSDGGFLSLQSVMGISSMRGYSTTEPAINETRVKASKQSPAKAETINPEVIDNFEFDEMWKPETRDLYDMAALIMADPSIVKGVWQYCGLVVRQIIAKKDSSASSFEKYCEGDKRAMTAKMWKKL